MPDKSNNPFQFWEELKRRKVFRVIAMYAGAAYIIIELVNNVAEPLHLPDWTATFTILLLVIGLPVVIILAWIFDITPEGVKKTDSIEVAKEQEIPSAPAKKKLRTSNIIIAVLLVVVGILAYPKIFKKDKFEDIRDTDGRISIAVMPFENLTGDTTLNFFQNGISSIISNELGTSSELNVCDDHTMFEITESINKVSNAGFSPSMAKELAEKIRAETYITGSYLGRDGIYWILANLVDTKSGNKIWTGKVKGDLNSSEYFDLADSLSNKIKNYLEIKVLKQDVDIDFREVYTNSPEAYKYYIEGMNLFIAQRYPDAIGSLKKAIAIDSTFTFASFYIAWAYTRTNQFLQVGIWTQKAYNNKDRLPIMYQNWLELWYACYVSNSLPDIERYCYLLEGSEIESRLFWYDLGVTYYSFLKQSDRAIMAFERIEEISAKIGEDWKYSDFYNRYGQSLHSAGKHEKEKEIYEIMFRLFPDNINKIEVLYYQAVCAFSHKDTTKANEYLEEYLSIKKEIGRSSDNIEFWLGQLYSKADMSVEAEIHLRNAHKLKPQNGAYTYNLADFLIEENINVKEGLELIQKLNPDNMWVLRTKGWGYYKLGRYDEALQYLRKADELALMPYNDLKKQIQEVEKAIANQDK